MHSPGPWKTAFTISKVLGVRNAERFICMLPLPSHFTGQDARYYKEMMEMEYNAALIAAAPEMLEILKDIAAENEAAAKLVAKIESAVSE